MAAARPAAVSQEAAPGATAAEDNGRERWTAMTQTTESDEQAGRMQRALTPVLQIGPDFLAGRQDAVAMAHTMVDAVQGFVDGERARAAGHAPADDVPAVPAVRAPQELEAALVEIYGCGSGFLADRCDAACVARTMTQIMGEFGDLAAAH